MKTLLKRVMTSLMASMIALGWCASALAQQQDNTIWRLYDVEFGNGETLTGTFQLTSSAVFTGFFEITLTTDSQEEVYTGFSAELASEGLSMTLPHLDGTDLTGRTGVRLAWTQSLAQHDAPVSLDLANSTTLTCLNADCSMFNALSPAVSGRIDPAKLWYVDGLRTADGSAYNGSLHYSATEQRIESFFLQDQFGIPIGSVRGSFPVAGGVSIAVSGLQTLTGQLLGIAFELQQPLSREEGIANLDATQPAIFSRCTVDEATGACLSVEIVDINQVRLITEPNVLNFAFVFDIGVDEGTTFVNDFEASSTYDSEGSGIVYSLSGIDAAAFSIDPDFGVLSFNSPPFVDQPMDQDGDNQYNIKVTAQAFGASASNGFPVRVLPPPPLAWSSSVVAFGDVATFGGPWRQTVDLINTSGADVPIQSIYIEGDDATRFVVENPGTCSSIFPSGSGCRLSLRYLPSLFSGPLNATLNVDYGDQGSRSSAVSGGRTLAVPITANVVIGQIQAPATANLGFVVAGQPRTVAIPVTLIGPMQFLGVATDEPDGVFSATSDCPAETFADVACVVNVTVNAPTAGSYAATILVETIDPASPVSEIAVSASAFGPADDDGDGVDNLFDNCSAVANPDQRDTDADGFGNVCDPDLNNDFIVNFQDLGLLRSAFFSTNADADFDGDGVVNFVDLGVMRSFFFQPPGPGPYASE